VPVLNLILADLYAASDLSATSGWPRLPALEYWLARGDAQAISNGWRDWLGVELAGTAMAGCAPAIVAAAAANVAANGSATETMPATGPSGSLWLATPVHYLVGLDSLRLHPGGLLTLASNEQMLLAADFARAFAGSGWQLLSTGRRELLLAGPVMAVPQTVDPARLLGADPANAQPRGEGAATLRRLAAEIEMWLHEHAVNRAREQRGTAVVNGLWLWGGGLQSAATFAATVTRGEQQLYGEDLYTQGLARHCGRQARALPAGAAAILDAGADVSVVLTVGGADAGASLGALEQQWLAPALAASRRARGRQARLLLADRCWTIGPSSHWRWWRRAGPWWESLR
jgi:hypothetical protein